MNKTPNKVLFVASVVKLHINLFHTPFLKMFKERGWETAVAAHDDYDASEDNSIAYCDSFYEVPFSKNPFRITNIKAYNILKQTINDGKYDVIHCHTPIAALLTRIAARKARKTGCRVIYTAHGFHFFKGAPIINWLLYFPAEWFASFLTDTLITINKEDYTFAQKHMHAKSIEYVPGVGIDLSKFSKSKELRLQTRSMLGLTDDTKMILSVGELSPRKNQQLVINALAELKELDWKYYIVGQGALKEELESLIKSKSLERRVELLGFRKDVNALMNAADLFVFPSKQEGLPVALMEAIACQTPVICSKIRGNADLAENDCLFELGDVTCLKNILSDCIRFDINLKCVKQNYDRVQLFSNDNVNRIMEKLYFECVSS